MKRSGHKYVWRFGPLFQQDIYCSGEADLYLRRWALNLPFGRALYLHRFVRPDIEIYHDHPWDFSSLILRGTYVEMSCAWGPVERVNAKSHGEIGIEERREFSAGDVVHHKAHDLHYIEALQPPNGRGSVWTLVFRGRRVRDWGFIVRGDGWVDWRRYLGVEQ